MPTFTQVEALQYKPAPQSALLPQRACVRYTFSTKIRISKPRDILQMLSDIHLNNEGRIYLFRFAYLIDLNALIIL